VIRISIDAMGGDHGPNVVIPALMTVAVRRPDIRFIIYGREEVVRPELAKFPKLAEVSEFHHCEIAVRMDDKPSQALRHGRWKSSMWKAVEAVKSGTAQACISAGNTGALMAMSKFCLRTMATIDRPAIAALWPTLRGESVVLDVGATIGADAHQLIDFAILGTGMARSVFGIDRPKVGLLNVGVEEIKGQEEVKDAGRLIREANLESLEYSGFVEGDDIGKGTVDVVVTEGFSGNIALKTAEGTAKQISGYLREAMSRTLFARIGYFFAKGAFDMLREKLDPSKVNGGVFLGLNGQERSYSENRKRSQEISCQASAADRAGSCHERRGIISMIRSVVRGFGAALPKRVMTNSEMETVVDTSDDWIVQRTGIRQRYIAGEGETTASLGEAAARAALDNAGLTVADIDLIILATSTPDNTFPATAVNIQNRLGMHHGFAFDMQAVCSGFVYAVTTADAYIRGGLARRVLVIGAETFSRILDWNDRTTCVLFGDGAGALILEKADGEGTVADRGVLTASLRSDGAHKDKLFVDGGPSSTGTVGQLRMEGREVFKYAVGMITDVIVAAFEATGTTADDLDWLVPHQANRRIIDGSAKKLGIPPEKVVITVDLHGNTSAASIPLALATAAGDGRIKKGDLVMLEAMGGGFTWGAVLLRW
jgi:3-oxoacyl-[acyl-carrier-protein] synthase-3